MRRLFSKVSVKLEEKIETRTGVSVFRVSKSP
jgi:hypothetical protein